MARLAWDKVSERLYETGIDHMVLYKQDNTGAYPKGVVWNGITAFTESPSGAEPNPQYADNIKYLNILSAEEFGGTLEAFNSPKEFDECDGSAEIIPGVVIGQQTRKGFGLCYRTVLGNDVKYNDYGYKLHLVWGGLAAPSEKNYASINDSPELTPLSWEISTTPVEYTGYKPTATMTIDSTTVDPDKLAALLDVLYGTDAGSGGSETEARLPLPLEVVSILSAG